MVNSFILPLKVKSSQPVEGYPATADGKLPDGKVLPGAIGNPIIMPSTGRWKR